ncbi:hypothetical protein Rsub_11933 [Raphidocelis subcapitata]|uniref:Cyclic nucleotide-binding domain-containing protein n=1 Tax=Raphidocelis subcapitata TaxID=307507 RepID=A0A2V0PPP5_9CHLO|nr:hypothetical protein Rsub_11933 [Raphidocelis subcapitata]|eukprot:GBF99447.1 hypothetical protein Rsub_11933 [Raphidocelis subcapitata]
MPRASDPPPSGGAAAAAGAALGASSAPAGGARGALGRLLHARRHTVDPMDEEAPTTPRRASESDAEHAPHAASGARGGGGGGGGVVPFMGRLSHLFARPSTGHPPSPEGPSGQQMHRASIKSVSRPGTDTSDAAAPSMVLPEHAAKLVGGGPVPWRGAYRERMQCLVSYCNANNLPQDMKTNMQGLLRLHMSLQGESTSDEAVLAVFPTSVRRRILRQLYAEPLASCYLFRDCGRKFLDAVMTTARVELFLPKIVAALDHVNELYVIVSGLVEVVDESGRPAITAHERAQADPTAAAAQGGGRGLSRASTLATAAYGTRGVTAALNSSRQAAFGGPDGGGAVDEDGSEEGEHQVLGPGDCFAEVAYFTEVPKADSARCLTVCRVLVLPRSAYTAIATNFPISARQVLENLKNRAEELVRQHVPEDLARSLLKQGASRPSTFSTPSAAALEDGTPLGAAEPRAAAAAAAAGSRDSAGLAAGLSRRGRVPQEEGGGGAGGGGGDGALSRRGRLPGTAGLSASSMSAFARAESMARALSGPPNGTIPEDGDGAGPAPSGRPPRPEAAGGAGAGAGGGGGGRRMMLSSLSMPLRGGGARRVAAALEGIASASVVEDGEGLGGGNEWGLTLQQQRAVADLMRLRQLVHKAVSKMDQSRLEALLYAAGSGEADAVQGLLRQGMSPDSANAEGTTPLLLSAAKGHHEVVLALLFSGADPSKCDAAGRSPLLLACQAGHANVSEILMRYGAKLGMEPVMLAAYLCKIVFEGKMDELRHLLRARADPNAQDYDRQSPLHVAAAEGNLPAARVLVEQGRANIAITDRWGRTPLDTALKAGAMQVVEYLEGRPEVSSEQREHARERFEQERTDELLNACVWGDLEDVEGLLARRCPVDARDYDGRTALFVAAVNGQAEVARALLAAGADPNARNSFGSCPLLEACLSGHDALVDILLAAGGRLNQPEVEEAALLSTVIHSGDAPLLRRLLRAAANPNASDYDGRSPLHVAASRGAVEALQAIAAAEDDPAVEALPAVDWEAPDRYGATPADEASRSGHADAAALLHARAEAARAGGPGPGSSGARARARAAASSAGGSAAPPPGGFALRFGRQPTGAPWARVQRAHSGPGLPRAGSGVSLGPTLILGNPANNSGVQQPEASHAAVPAPAEGAAGPAPAVDAEGAEAAAVAGARPPGSSASAAAHEP